MKDPITSAMAAILALACSIGCDGARPPSSPAPLPPSATESDAIEDAAQPTLTIDAAFEARLDLIHGVLQPDAESIIPEEAHYCGGAAAGDFDNDGWIDLYVTRINLPNALFRNRGNGTFENVATRARVDIEGLSSGCIWGDVNNDGHLDLYVTMLDDRNYLFVNDGTGAFTDQARERSAVLAPRSNAWSTSAAFGDYDLDGDLDLHVVEWADPDARNRLLQNDGDGYFEDVTESSGVAMPSTWGFSTGFADMDSDGWVDLVIAADYGTSNLFRNLGDGTFENVTSSARVGTDENGMGSAIGDVDNDGDLDWFVTSIFDAHELCPSGEGACGWSYSGNRLFSNDGHMRFSDATDQFAVRDGGWGWGASFLDFDNDGDLDLAMANGIIFPGFEDENHFNADPLRLWQNSGDGTMIEVSALHGFEDTRAGKGLVVFDYDRDGDLDIYVANTFDRPYLFRNDSFVDNNWLRVELQGVETNRFGIGARIWLQATAGGPVQFREVHANSNYLSQNELTAHFGLGPGIKKILSLRVAWPVSGNVQEFKNIQSNQQITINEHGASYAAKPFPNSIKSNHQ